MMVTHSAVPWFQEHLDPSAHTSRGGGDFTGLQYAERESLRASSEGMKHSFLLSLFFAIRVRSQVYHGAFWKPRETDARSSRHCF